MDVEFVNRYTVSREGQSPFFIDPVRRRAERNVMPASNGGGRTGTVVRWLGLGLALAIMAIALIGGMWIFFIMGLVLAMVYGLRILQLRDRQQNMDDRQAQRLENIIALQQAPKWVRFIRFGNFIEKEDPESWKQYKYEQITRITQDRAYITLWMDDDTQVRVYKDGFIIGTLEGFEPFIEEKAHLTGIPVLETAENAGSEDQAGTSGRQQADSPPAEEEA